MNMNMNCVPMPYEGDFGMDQRKMMPQMQTMPCYMSCAPGTTLNGGNAGQLSMQMPVTEMPQMSALPMSYPLNGNAVQPLSYGSMPYGAQLPTMMQMPTVSRLSPGAVTPLNSMAIDGPGVNVMVPDAQSMGQLSMPQMQLGGLTAGYGGGQQQQVYQNNCMENCGKQNAAPQSVNGNAQCQWGHAPGNYASAWPQQQYQQDPNEQQMQQQMFQQLQQQQAQQQQLQQQQFQQQQQQQQQFQQQQHKQQQPRKSPYDNCHHNREVRNGLNSPSHWDENKFSKIANIYTKGKNGERVPRWR